MSETTGDQIVFEVETERVLEILSKEIYDSPLALLRENVQNAYDATLMRATDEGKGLQDAVIEVNVDPQKIVIKDSGIGMNEEVLRNNFWKAGSSGKRTELAKKAGVIGTFGSARWPTSVYARSCASKRAQWARIRRSSARQSGLSSPFRGNVSTWSGSGTTAHRGLSSSPSWTRRARFRRARHGATSILT